MSQAMQPPAGAPPAGGQDPMTANRSPLNPTDNAAMQKMGQLDPNMTTAEFIENVVGVSLDAPATEFGKGLLRLVENGQLMAPGGGGKMANMAQGAGAPPAGAPPQPGMPPASGSPGPSPNGGGLKALMGK